MMAMTMTTMTTLYEMGKNSSIVMRLIPLQEKDLLDKIKEYCLGRFVAYDEMDLVYEVADVTVERINVRNISKTKGYP